MQRPARAPWGTWQLTQATSRPPSQQQATERPSIGAGASLLFTSRSRTTTSQPSKKSSPLKPVAMPAAAKSQATFVPAPANSTVSSRAAASRSTTGDGSAPAP